MIAGTLYTMGRPRPSHAMVERSLGADLGSGRHGGPPPPSGWVILPEVEILFSTGESVVPDLVGWRRVVVTPEMVGRDIAVFVGIEGKTPGTRTTPEQRNFLQQIARWGGEAKIAREDGFEEVEAC